MQEIELRDIYSKAKAANSRIHSEQRSNLQLVAGNHYQKNSSRFSRALRNFEKVSKNVKLRLTKNHISRITKIYRNEILSLAPTASIKAKNETERSDQKSAELNSSVWEDAKQANKLVPLNRELCQDFIDVGECFVKIIFDHDKGDFIGYELEETDRGIETDEYGEPKAVPTFKGGFVYERILGFNLLTDPTARSWHECQYVIVLKMKPTNELKKIYKDNPEVYGVISSTTEQTYKLFDDNGNVCDSQGLTMIREYYYRPSKIYPEGHYFICIEDTIIHEGDLPKGLFPILKCGFDDLPTSARSQSIIKQLRPFQAEINRCASRIAYTQCVVGDDKLVIRNGGNLSAGGTYHGVKTIRSNGGEVTVIPGRNGEQFINYMYGEIKGMYQVADLEHIISDKQPVTGGDQNSLLFASLRNRKNMSLYIEKWVEFQKEICELTLELARHFYTEDMIIPIVGKKEQLNIAEFKNNEKLGYQIVIEESTDDVSSKMGRHLTLQHILQYAGGGLDKAELGGIIRALPYANCESAVADLTIDFDNVTNDIIAMDRGIMRNANDHDNHDYYIKHLIKRQKEQDYEYLPDDVKKAYDIKIKQHEVAKQNELMAHKKLTADLIPTTGYLITCDFYVPNPDPTKKASKAKIPSDALQHLIDGMEAQGHTQQSLAEMEGKALVDMARRQGELQQQQQQGENAGMGMPPQQQLM